MQQKHKAIKISSPVQTEIPAAKKYFFQPKLTVNEPGDEYEREADAVAERVMRMRNDEPVHQPFFSPAASAVQRRCQHCEEEKVQRKESGREGTPAGASTEDYIGSLPHKGKGLTRAERNFFEPRFGCDFSGVRLHTNGEANQSAGSVHALAYTHGNDIVFGPGQYRPDSAEGKKLLAHELTHVVQQRSALVAGIQKQEASPLKPNPYTDDNVLALNPYDVKQLRAEENALMERLLEPLGRRDSMGFMVRLRTLNGDDTRTLLFSKNCRRVFEERFSGNGLYSLFSVLFTNLHLQNSSLISLGLALHDKNPQNVADALGVLEIDQAYRKVLEEVLRIVLPQIFPGNPFLPQMRELLDGKAQRGHASVDVREAHYEKTKTGKSEMSYGGSYNEIFFRATPQEMRVVSKLRFVKPGARQEPFYFLEDCNKKNNPEHLELKSQDPFYFSRDCDKILQSWLQRIQTVWNNRFLLSNGITTLRLVFLPVVINDANVSPVEVHTDKKDTCSGLLQPGRAHSNCWFTEDDAKVAAHEFGHRIGASDEYNLPATAAEIPEEISSRLTPEDIALTTLQGIAGGSHPPPPGELGRNVDKSLMSDDDSHVHLRHIQRLVNAINSSLPAGTPPYRAGEVT